MSQAGMPVRWVFVDRDGTVNVAPAAGDYVTEPSQLQLMPGAAAAIRLLNRAGVWVGILTNQRGIALGSMSERDLDAVHAHLRDLLAEHGARLDAIYHCPHERDSCSCRKPKPGLLLRARGDHPEIDFAQAAMVGDSQADVQAGRAVGAHTILLAPGGLDGPAAGSADHVVGSLLDAVRLLAATRGLDGVWLPG